MSSKSADFSLIHDNDPVRTLNTGNTLCNDQLGSIRNFFCKSSSDTCICGSIYRTCGIIQNQYFGFLKKSSGDTQTLFLTAGNIGSALLNISIVFVRHFLNEVIRTGKLTRSAALFLRSLFISPAQILQNGTGKQHILLKYNCYLVTQTIHMVVTHIHAANFH